MFYELEKIENCRDLGGIKTKDGKRIKQGMLFRAGSLSNGTVSDQNKLEQLGINLVVDFRSFEEIVENPDLKLATATYCHMQANDDGMQGVSREKKKEGNFFARMIETSKTNPNAFPEHMMASYRRLINTKHSNEVYQKFIQLLADDNFDKVLWHCTAGKDRTGIAGILILEILGVDKKNIYDNYLETNEHLKASTEELIKTIHAKVEDSQLADEISKGFAKALSADLCFIDAAYDEMEKLSGTVEHYLQEYIGVTDELKEKLKKKYLED